MFNAIKQVLDRMIILSVACLTVIFAMCVAYNVYTVATGMFKVIDLMATLAGELTFLASHGLL